MNGLKSHALNELLIVDPGVKDADKLLDGLSPSVDVIKLCDAKEPLDQIAAALTARPQTDILHILSHGEPGALALGGDRFDKAALDANPTAVAAINGALMKSAKIALWACSVAKGSLGKAFTGALEAATGTSVFASERPVGAADKGGNWDIGTPAPFTPAAMAAYGHTLPVFDGVGGISNNEDYIEADNGDGITMTTTFVGDAASTPASDGIGGASGNIWSAAGFNTTSVTITFSAPVTITSFVYLEADLVASAGNYTFSVSSGPGSTFFLDETDFTNIAGGDGVTITPNNWFGVTQITITSSSASWTPAFDTLVYNVNTAPTISLDNAALTFSEGDGAIQIDSAGTVSDPDGDGDWTNGLLVAQITGNAEADDEISISDTDGDSITITISGSNILANGVDVGDFLSSSTVTGGTSLTIEWDEDATNAIVQEVLQSLRYRSTSEGPSELDRTITISAFDGTGDGASDTRTVQVSAIEDAPTVTGLTNRGATEDITGALDFSAVTIADVDTSGNITVTITATDTGAVLGAVNGSGVGAGVTETATGNNVVTLVGTAADITTYLSTPSAITYTSSLNRETDDTISIQADDGVSTPNAASTATIVITPLNDAPTASDETINMNEDTSYVFTASDFNFSDVDSGDTLTSVRIDTLTVASGTFELSGVAVSASDVIAVADINAGNLVYRPGANANGNDLLNLTSASMTAQLSRRQPAR